MTDNDNTIKEKSKDEFRYILVGNVIGEHLYGEAREVKNGTKQFRPGAKIYLLPEFDGEGHKNIPVYGLPRKSWRKITIIIRVELIENVRVKKTYDPKLIELVKNCPFYTYCEVEVLLKFADSLNGKTNEIEE